MVVAGCLALADIGTTHYLLKNDSIAFEANIKVDASSFSALLGGATISLALTSGLFIASLAMCMANQRGRKILQISSKWDEIFIRGPGATAIWYIITLIGAVFNNVGMILFEFSWLQTVFGLFGLHSSNDIMAGFVLYPLVSMVILIVPSYLIFGKIVDFAMQTVPKDAKSASQTS